LALCYDDVIMMYFCHVAGTVDDMAADVLDYMEDDMIVWWRCRQMTWHWCEAVAGDVDATS